MFAAAAVVAVEEDDLIRRNAVRAVLRFERRILRDAANPFDVDPEHFRKFYRQTLFLYLCTLRYVKFLALRQNDALRRLSVHLARQLVDRLDEALTRNKVDGVPPHLQVLSTLRFYAEGGYQKGVGQDFRHPLSQTMISRTVERVTDAIIDIADDYIQFPCTRADRILCAQQFARHIRIPRILGVIDCVLVSMISPREDEEAFYNYKGYHALNVQVVSDANYIIRDIRICPGSNNDRHVWQHSDMKEHLEMLRADAEILRTEGRYYFLGDSGYTPSPVLLTPIRRAPQGTPEAVYTHEVVHTRCKVEQLFGIWTALWRAIKRERKSPYQPEKLAKIITACAVLHNFRRLDGVAYAMLEEPNDNVNQPAARMNFQAGIAEREALIDAYYRP